MSRSRIPPSGGRRFSVVRPASCWVGAAPSTVRSTSAARGGITIIGRRRGRGDGVFEEVLPYFLRSESWSGRPHPNRGAHGRCQYRRCGRLTPTCRAFLAACAEIGLPTLEDCNGLDMEGAFATQGSQRNGWRCSTEMAYLRPARLRRNLHVITRAEVERIVFEAIVLSVLCSREVASSSG